MHVCIIKKNVSLVMSINVMTGRAARNGSGFPANSYEEPFGTIEDSVHLPASLTPAPRRGGLVRLLFFSFKHLDRILSDYFAETYEISSRTDSSSTSHNLRRRHVINSRIIGAGVSWPAAKLPPTGQVRVTLKHIVEGLAGPVCVSYDPEEAAWTERWCSLVASNSSASVCSCGHLSTYALLMSEEEAAVTTAVQLPSFHLEIILASAAAAVVLIILICGLKVGKPRGPNISSSHF